MALATLPPIGAVKLFKVPIKVSVLPLKEVAFGAQTLADGLYYKLPIMAAAEPVTSPAAYVKSNV